jgi:hypothetical protein
MRVFGQVAAAAAILSLGTAPAIAATHSASALSLRASTASKHKGELVPGALIGIIGIAAIVAGGVIIATDDDSPDSP